MSLTEYALVASIIAVLGGLPNLGSLAVLVLFAGGLIGAAFGIVYLVRIVLLFILPRS